MNSEKDYRDAPLINNSYFSWLLKNFSHLKSFDFKSKQDYLQFGREMHTLVLEPNKVDFEPSFVQLDMAKVAKEFAPLQEILQHQDTKVEVVYQNKHYKGRLDILNKPLNLVVDYKTSSTKNAKDFKKNIAIFHYDMAGFFYCTLAGVERFTFMVQYKEPPYNMYLYEVTPEDLQSGKDKFILARYLHTKARFEMYMNRPK
jgi:hypothetical protein